MLAHLQGRETPKVVQFAANRFLSGADQIVTQRRGLRDVALLLLRLLLLLLVILALARPAQIGRSAVAVVGEPHEAMLVLDGSRSMGLVVDGRPLAHHALDQAELLLDALPPGTRVGLVTSDPGGPRIDPSANPDPVRAALRDWVEHGRRPGAWPLSDGVAAANAFLAELGGERKRVIYAIGDATARGLGSVAASDDETIVVPIAALGDHDQPLPEHVSIDEVRWEPAPEIDPRALRIHTIVRRHGGSDTAKDAPPVPVGVALRIGDQEVARATVELPPDRDVPFEFTHQLLGDAAAAAASVVIVDRVDALPSDDVRHMWLSVDDAVDVTIVNGEPSELRAHDEVFFLTTALASSESGHRVRVSSMAPDQLEQLVRQRGERGLDDVDVLVLANVRAPSEDVAPTIVKRVDAGMGVLITAGGQVDVAAYNARLGRLLPLPIREAVTVGTAPGRTEAQAQGFAPANLSHPAFHGLQGDLGLSGGRARRVFLLEPDPNRPHDIAVSFENGAPALVTRDDGAGRVGLLTTTIDRDWADLPLRPGFVALVERTLVYLAGSGASAEGASLLVGEIRRLRTDEPLTIRSPAGTKTSVAPDESGMATFRDTFEVGHYRVGDADTERLHPPFAVVVDPVDSRTAAVTIADPEIGKDQTEVSTVTPRWRVLVLLAAVVLGLESLVRWRKRAR